MRLFLLFVLLLTLLLLVSCKKYVAADDAFFIRPGLISVSAKASQGSPNHKITDLWVYVDGQFKGSYAVENTIPITSKGQRVSIDILAGIKNNGLKDTRIFSPFYEILHFDTLVPNRTTITRPFTFSYKAAATFAWVEDFEGQAYSIVASNNSGSSTFETVSGAAAFEGKSLRMTGNGSNFIKLESSGSGFSIPIGNANVYLELNYKCNYDLAIGVINSSGVETKTFFLNPQSTWNKIYVSLADAVNATSNPGKQKVFFSMAQTGDAAPELYLDNIKLVYL